MSLLSDSWFVDSPTVYVPDKGKCALLRLLLSWTVHESWGHDVVNQRRSLQELLAMSEPPASSPLRRSVYVVEPVSKVFSVMLRACEGVEVRASVHSALRNLNIDVAVILNGIVLAHPCRCGRAVEVLGESLDTSIQHTWSLREVYTSQVSQCVCVVVRKGGL